MSEAEDPGSRFTEGELMVLRAREDLSVSEWAERHLMVMDGPLRGGPLRSEATPYLKFIMDSFNDPFVEQIVVCGSPQTGKTLAMYACLGYSTDRRTGTKMLAMPDDTNVNRVAEEKLKPMFRGAGLLSKAVSGSTQDQLRLKNGTSIFLSSAQSPAQRASISVKDLFLDEEDLYQTIRGKGSPVGDFIERTRSYAFNRKIMRVSKPVGDGSSSIWRALLESEILYSYAAPCPGCGAEQFFREDAVRVLADPRADPEGSGYPAEIESLDLGRYECPGCGCLINSHDRDGMVRLGRWRPSAVRELSETGTPVFEVTEKAPDQARKIGFHLPAILSRYVSLSGLAARREAAEKSEDSEVRQGQANGDWARPYIAVLMNPRRTEILRRADPELPARTVPRDAVCLTMGIDTQKYDFYYLVTAWMPDMTKYVIDYGRFQSFDEIAAFVTESSYPVLGSDGGEAGRMQIWRAGIDTGGTVAEGAYSRTEEVYEFCWKNQHLSVFAVKGSSGHQTENVRRTSIVRLPGRKTPLSGGIPMYLLNTGNLKEGMLKALTDPGHSRPMKLYGFDPKRPEMPPEELHAELAAHFTAERQVRSPQGKIIWVQERRDNHYLDCGMIACACGDVTWTPSIVMAVELKKKEAEVEALLAARPLVSTDYRRPDPGRRRGGWGSGRRR